MLSWVAIRRARRTLRLSSAGAEDWDDIPLHTRNDNVSNSDSSQTLNSSEDDIQNAARKSPVLKVTEKPTLCKHAPHDGKLDAFTFEDWWIWEVLGLIGSLAALIAIVVILAKYNHQQQPHWSHVSLNTLLSWLSTVAKACALIPITKGLSQLKWVWFVERERKLCDLRTFDAASRGVVGSFELLWRLRGRHLATFASLGIILALGFEPFVQNLIHYYPQNVPSETEPAFLASSSIYDQIGYRYDSAWDKAAYISAHPSLTSNIFNAIYNFDKTKSWAQPLHVCRTGDCTWDFVSTLVVRSQCSDVSDRLIHDVHPPTELDTILYRIADPELGRMHSVSFPGIGPFLKYYDSGGQGSPSGDMMIVEATDRGAPPWAVQSIEPIKELKLDDMEWLTHSEGIFIGTDCKLVPCIRSFRAIVSGGVYREENVEDWCEGGGFSRERPLWELQHPPWSSERGFRSGETYGITQDTILGISNYLNGSFNGWMGVLNGGIYADATQHHNTEGVEYQVLRAISHRKTTPADCENPAHKLNCTLASVAAAITKTIRDSLHVENGTDLAKMAHGKTLVTAQFVHVKWVWLVLPVLIWILSAATSLGTAWKTRRAKVQTWRHNPLPLLFLYGNGDIKSGLEQRGTSDGAFEKRAQSIKVQLHISEKEARFIEALAR